MTDVLILHRIPGLREGQVVEIDDENRARLEKAVAAGNAQILPAELEDWKSDPAPEAPEVARATSSLTLVEGDPALEDFDDDTEDDE